MNSEKVVIYSFNKYFGTYMCLVRLPPHGIYVLIGKAVTKQVNIKICQSVVSTVEEGKAG